MPYLVDPAAQAARRCVSSEDALHGLSSASTTVASAPAVSGVAQPIEPTSRQARGAATARPLAQTVARKIDAAREAERTRLARELHDGMGAHLTALQLAVARLALHASQGDAHLQSLYQQIQDATDAAQNAAAELVGNHQPPALDAGLVPALRAWLRNFGEQSGLLCIWRCDDTTRERVDNLTPSAVLALYRIAQEALTNVARHAHAKRAVVALDGSHRSLKLTITDDGCGLGRSARRKHGHFGLVGMRERCAALGGTLRVGSVQGSGTLVSARLPWHQILPAPAVDDAAGPVVPELFALHGYAS